MPPIQGETAMEKAERFRKAANVLREKARFTRVSTILKKRPDICATVEDTLIREGVLEADLATSPRSATTDDDHKPDPKPMMMIQDDSQLPPGEVDIFDGFKMEALPCMCGYRMEALGLLFY